MWLFVVSNDDKIYRFNNDKYCTEKKKKCTVKKVFKFDPEGRPLGR